MKYLSIDLETTGLDTDKCQVIEIAMVLEDTEKNVPVAELPYFHRLVWHATIVGEWKALDMNREILEKAQSKGVLSDDVWEHVCRWLRGQGINAVDRVTVAGKNVAGFDLQFFPAWVRKYFKHRVIDPGSVFMNWEKGPLSLGELLGRDVAHNALDDARDVIYVLREAY